MPASPNYAEDFQENLEGLIEDIILLDALVSREETDRSPLLRHLPAEFFSQTHQRILDYLTQHAADLYHITEYAKKAQGV